MLRNETVNVLKTTKCILKCLTARNSWRNKLKKKALTSCVFPIYSTLWIDTEIKSCSSSLPSGLTGRFLPNLLIIWCMRDDTALMAEHTGIGPITLSFEKHLTTTSVVQLWQSEATFRLKEKQWSLQEVRIALRASVISELKRIYQRKMSFGKYFCSPHDCLWRI